MIPQRPVSEPGEPRDLLLGYAEQGYTIYASPAAADLPPILKDFEIDYLARRGDEAVVIEVKQNVRRSREALRNLDKLAVRVSMLPGWRLELVWLGAPKLDLPSTDRVVELVERARRVGEMDTTAGLLMGWSAVEAALDLVLLRSRQEIPGGSARTKIAALASLGLISDDRFARLSESADLRNKAAHGRAAEVAPSILESVLQDALLLSQETYASVDQMIDWFHTQYDLPADGTGGIFSVRQELDEHFPDSDPNDRRDAARLLTAESSAWVKQRDD